MRRVAVTVDLAAVVVFVVIGRNAHHHGETVGGIWSTAWPFLAGLAVGWAYLLRRSRLGASVGDGIPAWLSTVAIGMALRVVAGQGTAAAFIVVALCFLGATMLGGRAAGSSLAGMARGRATGAGRTPGAAP